MATLLGRWNWWLPRWLDRAMPRVLDHTPPTLAPERVPSMAE